MEGAGPTIASSVGLADAPGGPCVVVVAHPSTKSYHVVAGGGVAGYRAVLKGRENTKGSFFRLCDVLTRRETRRRERSIYLGRKFPIRIYYTRADPASRHPTIRSPRRTRAAAGCRPSQRRDFRCLCVTVCDQRSKCDYIISRKNAGVGPTPRRAASDRVALALARQHGCFFCKLVRRCKPRQGTGRSHRSRTGPPRYWGRAGRAPGTGRSFPPSCRGWRCHEGTRRPCAAAPAR